MTPTLLTPKTAIPASPRTPAEVRAAVLAQHAELREVLFEADRLARRVQSGHLEDLGPMRAISSVLSTALCTHLDIEEAWAVPHLSQADSWGPVRVRQLLIEHEAQRASAAALARVERRGDLAELTRSLRELAHTLLEDMRIEEREMLAESVLRDDAVAIDQADG